MIEINNKNWENTRSSDITKYLADGEENTFFEYKQDDTTPNDFVKEVAAFANTYGGYIFLGISDTKEILGCKKWTEERIANAIFNNLTPLPSFAVKKFRIDSRIIYVTKIEQGNRPPYITNKGIIYERISSCSCKITTSEKLSELISKNLEQSKNTENELYLAPLKIDNNLPSNLCAYIDFGFEVTNSQTTTLQQNWAGFNFTPVSEYLRKTCGEFSISRVGMSFTFSIGKLQAESSSQPVRPVSALHNFVDIMLDGSTRGRLLLYYDNSGKVDIGTILFYNNCLIEIYKLIFGVKFYKYFICARKYEKITVLKQFTPYYSVFNEDKKQSLYLKNHQLKYGDNLIINGNRIPTNDYILIDRRYFEMHKVKYNNDNLIEELFKTYYFNLGYIDPPKQ